MTKPTTVQEQVIYSDADITFFAAGCGQGKTTAMVMAAKNRATETGQISHLIHRPEEGESLDLGDKVKYLSVNPREFDSEYCGYHFSTVCIDDVQSLGESGFWYALSRCRGFSGNPPKIYASTNPINMNELQGRLTIDKRWIGFLLAWWIDEQGFAIPARSGEKRFFKIVGNCIRWSPVEDRTTVSITLISPVPNTVDSIKPNKWL